jgi:radical SAM protein with 4Fe4S-binding SPASM domain
MAEFPHLIDVGIMGHCIHGRSGRCLEAGIGCYQSGSVVQKPNMSLSDFEDVVKQCASRVDQFALGGRGDPDQHENFAEILELCYNHGIVPNFTTSGFGITKELAMECWRCGAVAVSWYRSDYTLNAIKTLRYAGVKTNIHYVLGNSSIDEAIDRLLNNGFPEGINAVIFLLHKPVGLGKADDVLRMGDPRLRTLFELLDKGGLPYKVGIDSCTSPGVLNHCKSVLLESIDTCEGGRFSCYIGSDMMMVPCSFDQTQRYAVSLWEQTIEQAWNSQPFETFRNHLRAACPGCVSRASCMGGCPLLPEIVLCDREERNLEIQD